MDDIRISDLPYVGHTGYTPNDLFVNVSYQNFVSGETKNTTLNDLKTYILSGSSGSGGTSVTSFSYDNANTITLTQSNGQSTGVTLNTFTGITVDGRVITDELQVTGGTLSIGYVLTSDGNGVATWQAPTGGGTFTGGTVSGETNFTSGLTANTISATSLTVNGVQITGDTYVTNFSYDNSNTITLGQSNGQSTGVTLNTFTALTINGDLSVTGTTKSETISATTYQNIQITSVSGLTDSLSNKFDKSGGTINGSLSVTGNFTVIGTATTINTQTLSVTDNLIILNSNLTGTTDAPFIGESGLQVLRGSATTVSLVWDEQSGKFKAGLSGNTKQIVLEGDSLSLLSSGHTHPITEINGLTAALSGKFDKSGGTITGLATFSNGLTGNTISGGTFYGDGSNLSGLYRGFTGGTVSGTTTFTSAVTINTLTVTGNTNVRSLTGTSAFISGSGQNILTVIGSGNSTTSPIFSVRGSSGELFSITDSLTGSLFSVNDISGLAILDVYSDGRVLMGPYPTMSLNTSVRTSLTAGTNTVYSIPTSAYTGAFFDYTLISTGSTGARAGTIMSIWSGSTAQYTDVSTNDIGTTTGVTFSVGVSGSNAVLSSSATTTGWTLKTIVRSI